MSAINRVWATVGLCGTGKSEATSHLASRLQAQVVYFGGVVRDEIRTRGLAENAENERRVREELRQEFGMDVVALKSLPGIREKVAEGSSVVIDGLYSFAEYQTLRRELADELTLVALHAPRPVRYERMARRSDRPFTPEQIDERDIREVSHLEKAPPIVLADHHIVNDGELSRLHESLDQILAAVCR